MIPRLQSDLPRTPLFAYSKRNRTGFYFGAVLVLLPHGTEISQTEFEQAWIAGATNTAPPENASETWLTAYSFAVKYG